MSRIASCALGLSALVQWGCADGTTAVDGVGGSAGKAGGTTTVTGAGAANSSGTPVGMAVPPQAGEAPASYGGSNSPTPSAPSPVEAYHLGKPFRIVDGVIDSNDYGLHASFYVVHDPEETDVEVTSTSGEVCVRGELVRALNGDFDSYWGFTAGFTTAPPELRQLTETLLSTSPTAPAWQLAPARVLGLAYDVSGPVLPNNPSFGLGATPGGQDSGGLYGVEQTQTVYGDCAAPPVTAQGQHFEAFFARMENWWCVPQNRTRWVGDSVVTFWWGVGSVIVDSIDADAGLNATPDPYDFCIRNLRPIVAGAGPDEVGELPSDAGSTTGAGDAGN